MEFKEITELHERINELALLSTNNNSLITQLYEEISELKKELAELKKNSK